MRSTLRPHAFALGIALAMQIAGPAAHAAGAVQVNFVKPETFTDIRDQAFSREHHLESLKQIVSEVALPYVADGQALTVDVLDVDLAGEPKHGARTHDVRVLRGRADWPRITLRWTLVSPGQAPQHGQAVVQDMAYFQRLRPTQLSGALPYERRMLAEWFSAEFGAAGGKSRVN